MSRSYSRAIGVLAMWSGMVSFAHATIMDEATQAGLPSVDWTVSGAYVYMFQVEVPDDVAPVNFFSLGFDTSEVIEFGWWAGDDLDDATEYHPVHAPLVGTDDDDYDLALSSILCAMTPEGITWTFVGGLATGSESQTLYFKHPRSPLYSFGGYGIPTPAPDGGFPVLLLGLALVALAGARRALSA